MSSLMSLSHSDIDSVVISESTVGDSRARRYVHGIHSKAREQKIHTNHELDDESASELCGELRFSSHVLRHRARLDSCFGPKVKNSTGSRQHSILGPESPNNLSFPLPSWAPQALAKPSSRGAMVPLSL